MKNDRGSSSRGLQYKNNNAAISSTKESPRLSEYNFNIDSLALVTAIGKIKGATWRLRDEVARLLKNGHLREFLSERERNNYKNREGNKKIEPKEPQHINIIKGGLEIPQGPVMKRTKFSITREKRNRDYVLDGFISFSDEEVEGITQPYNDALVISILINKTHVRHILIDIGSSVNIIRWKNVEQLGLLDQIVPTTRVLNGFNMACETTNGEITLPVNTTVVVQHIMFYVSDGEIKYNALFGRPWIHVMKAVPSTLYQMLKFPTPDGIKIVRGEQPTTKEMFPIEEAALKEPASKDPTASCTMNSDTDEKAK
ncbi:uncharacterized protein LOC132628607 [Lycium barbarum]|uniref:uncharacterized protein LOC132628607 n=1 Tax=Lycium barbarum TaxID=112863 RepID=UPI00293EF4F8|nr:uncharacterized protein LOC132628607 [Lycium barbarum]